MKINLISKNLGYLFFIIFKISESAFLMNLIATTDCLPHGSSRKNTKHESWSKVGLKQPSWQPMEAMLLLRADFKIIQYDLLPQVHCYLAMKIKS